MKAFYWLTTFLLMSACIQQAAKAPDPTTSPTPATQSGPVSSAIPHMSKDQAQVLIDAIRAELPNLDKAQNDMQRFCPKYLSLSPEQRVIAWAHFSAGVIKYESGCTDGDNCASDSVPFKTCASMTESTGVDSIGYFSLSYGDAFAPKNKAEGNLCDTALNTKTGIKIMGKLVSKDGVVASGGYEKAGAPSARGAAAYWSVTRVPDPNSWTSCDSQGNCKAVKRIHHLSDIMALTSAAPGCR